VPYEEITYTVIRSPKRNTTSIIIRDDNQVEVRAPKRIPTVQIEAFVQQKSAWIRKKLHFNRAVRTPFQAKSFQQGEAFQFRGKAYTLELQQGRRHVQIYAGGLIPNKLIVTHPAATADTTRKQITAWYRQQAEAHFTDRCSSIATRIGKSPCSVGVKAYKSRWGTCFHDGRIYFNWRLIMAPDDIIDYVVTHELCHLIHPNHSTAYWSLVRAHKPYYQQAAQWLKINGASLDL